MAQAYQNLLVSSPLHSPSADRRWLRQSTVISVTALFLCGSAIGGALAQDAGDGDGQALDFDLTDAAAEARRGQGGAMTVEGILLAREDLDSVPFTGPNATAGAGQEFTPFTSDDLDGSEISPGLRMTLRGKMLDMPIEASAFFMMPFELSANRLDLGNTTNRMTGTCAPNAAVNCTNAIYANDPGSDIDTINSENIAGLLIHHETKLFGGELSALTPFGIEGVTLGPRFIYFGEQLGSHSIQREQDIPFDASSPRRDRVSVRTDNFMYGLQAGVEGMFHVGGGLSIGGSVKGGLYLNDVQRYRSFRSVNQTVRRQESDDDGKQFSQAIEVNPRLEYRLNDTVTLTAAGTFLWLSNVSEAVSHYGTVTDLDDHDVRANGDVYFYGGTVGVKIALDDVSGDSGVGSSLEFVPPDAELSYSELDQRIAELEATSARQGEPRLNLNIWGSMSTGVLGWDDGYEQGVEVYNNTSSRPRVYFEGSARVTRGLTVGYQLGLGIATTADGNDIDQLDSVVPGGVTVRHSNWWVRHNTYGKASFGLLSPATDNVILRDTGGIMPGAANISTLGGNFRVRHVDEQVRGNDSLIERTSMDDFAGGSSIDTLRRNLIRYDTPRFNVAGGRLQFAASWGEDDFYDVGFSYNRYWNDWRFRSAGGYFHDKTTPTSRIPLGSKRDREEYKGSASLLHIPTGLFATGAYVVRKFNGFDPSDQTVFGENTTGIVTEPGTNRPDLEYYYIASGLRRQYSSIGDTSIYGEFARANDGITGLNEAGFGERTDGSTSSGRGEVTSSHMDMFGAAINQRIDAAAMDVFLGFRHFQFHARGVADVGGGRDTPSPLTDLNLIYGGSRIKF